jgi:hypothetical protein
MKPYNELTKEEKLACISLYAEEAKKDEDADIRLEAYHSLGYTDEAKKDKDDYIRLEAYRSLGYTDEAKKDKDDYIRLEAQVYFAVKNSK